MHYDLLNEEEASNYKMGVGISVAAVMAVLTAALVSVIAYKLFTSKKGNATIPGGWKFTWD